MAKTFGCFFVIPFENPFYKWNAENKYRQAEKIIENILERENVVCIKNNDIFENVCVREKRSRGVCI